MTRIRANNAENESLYFSSVWGHAGASGGGSLKKRNEEGDTGSWHDTKKNYTVWLDSKDVYTELDLDLTIIDVEC